MYTSAQGKSDRVLLDPAHLVSSIKRKDISKRRIIGIIQKKEMYQMNVASRIKPTITTAQRRKALIKIEQTVRIINTIPLCLLILHC